MRPLPVSPPPAEPGDPPGRRGLAGAGGAPPPAGDGQGIERDAADGQIRLEAKPGWSAGQGRSGVVVVKTELTDELIEEGLIRELIHHVQGLRKEHELAYETRITLYVSGPSELAAVVRKHAETVQSECLAEQVLFEAGAEVNMRDFKIENHDVKLGLAAHV